MLVGGNYLSFLTSLCGLETDACTVPMQENQAFRVHSALASQGPLVPLDFQDWMVSKESQVWTVCLKICDFVRTGK